MATPHAPRAATVPAMEAAVERGSETISLARGPLRVEIVLDPFSLRVERGGVNLVSDGRLWAQDGSGGDRLITVTEGVLVEERREPSDGVAAARWGGELTDGVRLDGETDGGRRCRIDVAVVSDSHVTVELEAAGAPFRLGASWGLVPGERLCGLGVRHGLDFDQAGRRVALGADRRYTGPDCPPELLEAGGIPQGDYVPVPWLLSSAGWGLWTETWGAGTEVDLRGGVSVSTRAAAGPLRVHLLCDPSPAARLRRYCRLTGLPALLPEWAYGFWKSRDVYEHADDVVDDLEGHLRNEIPLDAIVIDSPWETQYNTWEFNPRQFPDAAGLIARMRREGVRTVVWITPWVNLESADGQRPPDAESERLHREPAPNYEEGARAGHYLRDADGDPYIGRWWMGTGSPLDFTSPDARRWWIEQARGALELGVEGIKADDGEGYYFPGDVRFRDGRSGAEAAWAYPGLYADVMQEALDDVHPETGVLFGRSGWSGRQSTGVVWGGDQASDFWSLRALVAATLSAAASGFSNWSHDVGGYLGKRLMERCPRELLVRWAQFGCFTPLMQAHGRFEQEPWTYDERTLDTYREYVRLHERLVPYVRAAAATAARTGLPIIRPLCLTDPGDPHGWQIADAYGYGPALWVAPVLEEGAREREVYLPRGDWTDFWTGERTRGGRHVAAEAPLDRIPVWVRNGAIVVTYPEKHVKSGLGIGVAEDERPLEASMWGRPRLGSTGVRLADGTRIRWTHREWSLESRRNGGADREITFAER
jgi:alpha-glucosidase (family GH31 glycosyl hydrolase)